MLLKIKHTVIEYLLFKSQSLVHATRYNFLFSFFFSFRGNPFFARIDRISIVFIMITSSTVRRQYNVAQK